MEIDPQSFGQTAVYKLLIGCVVPRPIAWVSSTCITVTIITENVMAHLRAEPRGASLIRRRIAPPSRPRQASTKRCLMGRRSATLGRV